MSISLKATTFWQEVKNQLSNNSQLSNEEEAIDYVCTHCTHLINVPEFGGLYPIHIMISKFDIQRVNQLLKAGANLELKVMPQVNTVAGLPARLAERFQGMNAIEIAHYYSQNHTLNKKQKKIASQIYDLVLATNEKNKLEQIIQSDQTNSSNKVVKL